MRAVERAGGLALLLPATPDAVSAGMAQWLALCGGFVLPGGGDVAPTYYGQSPVPQLTSTDRLRDNVELTLCRAAAQHKKPLLGICRGAQVLNVAFGGTLWQDIPAQCRAAICHYQDSAARGELFHSLTLAPDSLLARIMGPGQHECNTFHHQAVRDVAPGFAAAARAGRPCGGGGKRGRPCAGRTVAPGESCARASGPCGHLYLAGGCGGRRRAPKALNKAPAQFFA